MIDLEQIEKFIINIVVSGSAAAISKTLVAPIDRIKIILQNQDSALQVLTGQRKKYKGLLDVIKRVPKEQGILSFWRGNGINIIRYIPLQAFNFSFNDFYIYVLGNCFSNETVLQATINKFIAGGLAGASSSLIVHPLDFCQTRIVADIGTDGRKARVKREFTGLRDCIGTVYQKDGVTGYYRGFPVAIAGIMVYRSCYFGLYDVAKRYASKGKAVKNDEDLPKLPLLVSLVTAQTVTIISGTLSYPFDTLLRRMMMDSARPKELRLFKGIRHAAVTLYKTGGIRVFYRGVASNAVRSLGGALVLVFYDEFLHYTNWKKRLKG